MDSIVKQTGRIDVLIDLAGPLAKEYGNGKMAVDLPVEEFMVPLTAMLRSRFITARAAARHMIKAHSGVIILVTGSPARPHDYHVEAAIAWVHTSAHLTEETDWAMVISLYDKLMAIRPSPIVALNRTIAIGQREGPQRSLGEICAIQGSERLAKYPFYHAALGELESSSGHFEEARAHFVVALKLARNAMERSFLEQRIGACK